MQTAIRIGMRQEFDNEDINEMYRLRARVFHGRLGWDIPTIAGMEIDGYDALGPHYMLIQADDRRVRGCWRLMPTEGPNMLKDTFPQLLHGAAAPVGRHIWELSRFAIDTSGEEKSFGFADVTMQAIHELVHFRRPHGHHALCDGDHHPDRAAVAQDRNRDKPSRLTAADRCGTRGGAGYRRKSEDPHGVVRADRRSRLATPRWSAARRRPRFAVLATAG